jgi:hypothetical protein
MNFSYIIFLLTFLIFPVFALVISRKIELKRYCRILWASIGIFLAHNVLFFVGLSFYGDYIDYLIFALEYFTLCLLIFSIPKDKIYAKAFRILGIVSIAFGFLVGLVGILLFIVISQDYESDKRIWFENSGKRYEVRRYSFGFATLEDTRYTFETYRRYKYLPLEFKIDKTDFFDSKTQVNISEDRLAIYIVNNGSGKALVFKSSDGNFFLKTLNKPY